MDCPRCGTFCSILDTACECGFDLKLGKQNDTSQRMEAFVCTSLRIRPAPAIHRMAITAPWIAASLLLGILARVVLVGAAVPWQFVAFACALGGFASFVLARARPISGKNVVEFVGDSIWIRAADGPGRRPRPRLVVTRPGVADAYVVTPSRLLLRLRNGTTVELDLEGESAPEIVSHLRATVEHRVLRTTATAFRWFLGRGPSLMTGLDGIRIDSARGRSRFIPYAIIKKVSRVGQRIVLETTTGIVRLPAFDGSEEITTALASRIDEGRAAAAVEDVPTLDLLARKQRSMDEWRTAMGALGLGCRGFRAPALSDDDLNETLLDPRAPLDRRIGAAFALRSRNGNARTWIRVAAATSAEPRVGIALDAAADVEIDDRAIERLLDEAEMDYAAVQQEIGSRKRAKRNRR